MKYITQIHSRGAVIIADVLLPSTILELLKSHVTTSGEELIIVDPICLASELQNIVVQKIQQKDQLLVFPGGGGRKVFNYFKPVDAHASFVHAQRIWVPGTDPVVSVGEIFPERIIMPEYTNICVIDDVVSTGKTLERLYERNSWKFPRATWSAVSLVGRHSKPKHYTDITFGLSVVHADTLAKKVPINSLSTLLEDERMAELYTVKNFQNPQSFLGVLNHIRCLKSGIQSELLVH